MLDKDGKQIGVVDIAEARKKSADLNLDLVEIAPKAKPPVVKIVDFKKFKYEESKKERVAKKKTRAVGTKEIWLGPFMSKNDLSTRTQQAKAFLVVGDRVKLTVKFKGRQMRHTEFGYRTLEEVVRNLSDVGEKDSEPKLVGRRLNLSIRPQKENKHGAKNEKNS